MSGCDILSLWDGKSHGKENTLIYARGVNNPAFLICVTN